MGGSDDRIQSLGLVVTYGPQWAVSPSIALAIGGAHGATSGNSSSWYLGVELAGGLSVAATPTLAVFSDVSLISIFGCNGLPELWVVGRAGVKINL